MIELHLFGRVSIEQLKELLIVIKRFGDRNPNCPIEIMTQSEDVTLSEVEEVMTEAGLKELSVPTNMKH